MQPGVRRTPRPAVSREARGRNVRPIRRTNGLMREFRPACLLVTGGAGFIGSNFVRWVLKNDPHVVVVNLDLLTYAGNLESLADVVAEHGAAGDGRYFFLHGDIRDVETLAAVVSGQAPQAAPAGLAPRPVPAPHAVCHQAPGS